MNNDAFPNGRFCDGRRDFGGDGGGDGDGGRCGRGGVSGDGGGGDGTLPVLVVELARSVMGDTWFRNLVES